MPYSSRSWNSTTHRNEKSVSELIHGAMKANSSFGAEKATDELYEVEKIVSYKIRQGKGYYRIRWKGYGKDSDTWVPEESMNCPLLIQEYHKRQIYEIGYCPQTLLDLLRVHSWTIIFRILLQLAHCRCFCAAGCLFWWFWHRFLFKIENETILQLFWRQSRCAMKLVHIIVILAIYGDVTMPLSWLVDCRGRKDRKLLIHFWDFIYLILPCYRMSDPICFKKMATTNVRDVYLSCFTESSVFQHSRYSPTTYTMTKSWVSRWSTTPLRHCR